MAKKKKIKITLKRSVIKSKPAQRKTVKALGLGKISSSVIHNVTDPILGMVKTVSHLVEVEEVK